MNIYQLHLLAYKSTQNQHRVQKELRIRRHRMLSRFFANPGRFVAVLEHHHSVVSGSFALNFLEGEAGWQANDVDVYVPYEEFEAMKSYLVDVEGYREDLEETLRRRARAEAVITHNALATEVVQDTDEPYLRHPVQTGICQVASLYRDGKKVDIIQNDSSSALYAITFFWSTLQMNYISARGYCCAYPMLTFRRIGVISPLVQTRELRPRAYIDPLVAKYQDRGYHFFTRWYFSVGARCATSHSHPLCPTQVRSFEDNYSLSGTFGSKRYPGTIGTPRGAIVSEWKVGWQLGGYHDDRSRLATSKAKCWHNVTGVMQTADNIAYYW
ncbi:hypothetical protein NM688_g15 [Phlebia brevispora]|uniref:Uncharacterized protein n=1 Tax=Phlebia brevispora TaxID=194682 RepID=A0ACC1TFS8_9APHY|nr:hypothetical protein NM688_g15 [Phlebia brevispora]